MSSKKGHVESKTKSLGQILEKPCVRSRGQTKSWTSSKMGHIGSKTTVKLVLETTCIKRPPALIDHCSDKRTLLKSTYQNLHLKTTCCKRPNLRNTLCML